MRSAAINTMRYYRITNADNKVWDLPSGSLPTAFALYQPSGWKGKMLKRLFSCVHMIPLARRLAHAELVDIQIADELKRECQRLFNNQELDFAFFYGTPSVHQKTTIQVYHKQHILGYCRLTEKKEVSELFKQEQIVLQELDRMKVKGAPKCLMNKCLTNGQYLFVQTTDKTLNSQPLHQWNDLTEAFVNQLYKATSKKTRFENTDFYATLQNVRRQQHWLTNSIDRDLYITLVDQLLERYQGAEVETVACHGDFTPWNMFVENGRLFVFDWEYAHLTYPKGLDKCHFFTQTAIFEQHLNAEQIINTLRSDEKWAEPESLQMYLIDIIARYTLREKGIYDEAMNSCMKIWIELLIFTNKQMNT